MDMWRINTALITTTKHHLDLEELLFVGVWGMVDAVTWSASEVMNWLSWAVMRLLVSFHQKLAVAQQVL